MCWGKPSGNRAPPELRREWWGGEWTILTCPLSGPGACVGQPASGYAEGDGRFRDRLPHRSNRSELPAGICVGPVPASCSGYWLEVDPRIPARRSPVPSDWMIRRARFIRALRSVKGLALSGLASIIRCSSASRSSKSSGMRAGRSTAAPLLGSMPFTAAGGRIGDGAAGREGRRCCRPPQVRHRNLRAGAIGGGRVSDRGGNRPGRAEARLGAGHGRSDLRMVDRLGIIPRAIRRGLRRDRRADHLRNNLGRTACGGSRRWQTSLQRAEPMMPIRLATIAILLRAPLPWVSSAGTAAVSTALSEGGNSSVAGSATGAVSIGATAVSFAGRCDRDGCICRSRGTRGGASGRGGDGLRSRSRRRSGGDGRGGLSRAHNRWEGSALCGVDDITGAGAVVVAGGAATGGTMIVSPVGETACASKG